MRGPSKGGIIYAILRFAHTPAMFVLGLALKSVGMCAPGVLGPSSRLPRTPPHTPPIPTPLLVILAPSSTTTPHLWRTVATIVAKSLDMVPARLRSGCSLASTFHRPYGPSWAELPLGLGVGTRQAGLRSARSPASFSPLCPLALQEMLPVYLPRAVLGLA